MSESSDSLLLDRFMDLTREKGLSLYPAQEEAILELFSGQNVILNTPTGSGKTWVATALQFLMLEQGKRAVYTSPIKALVNEKFLDLCALFGPEKVGMITGDASVNPNAPLIVCTAEILSNWALAYGEQAPVDAAILDEFHYYGDSERGAAWQIPLLTLSKTQFLLMSATLGEVDFFKGALTKLNGRETAVIQGSTRPVPLTHHYSEQPLMDTTVRLVRDSKAPVYLVCFTQRECVETAQSLTSHDFCSKDEKQELLARLKEARFTSPFGTDLLRYLRQGIGVHNAGLLPRYRLLVERLAQKGLLKVICGTDTLGVGINVPIRTVLLTQLCKFDGKKTSLVTSREFHQITGRAGRKGYDTEGFVVAQAPAHTIENLIQDQKAAIDPKKAKKTVKKKPPEQGYVHWDKAVFEKLIASHPESLTSRFQITHAMVLLVLSRDEDGAKALRRLIRSCHESDYIKKKLRQRAYELFRSLVDRKLVEILPTRLPSGRRVIAHVDLQEDFSLHHTLSLYFIDAVHALDPETLSFPMDVLSLCEAICDSPEIILRRQVDQLKTKLMQEMKAEGVEYDERIERLETVTHIKPLEDFIESTFATFKAVHPWVENGRPAPKSIARDMVEQFATFKGYVRDIGIERSEGLLLRYLSEVLKTLAQTLPVRLKTPEILAIEEYLLKTIEQTDSSLLDEWKRLQGIKIAELPEQSSDAPPPNPLPILRNQIHRILRDFSNADFELLEGELDLGVISRTELSALRDTYVKDHGRVRMDAEGRAHHLLEVKEGEYRHVMVDSEGLNDWEIRLSRENSRFVLLGIGPITS